MIYEKICWKMSVEGKIHHIERSMIEEYKSDNEWFLLTNEKVKWMEKLVVKHSENYYELPFIFLFPETRIFQHFLKWNDINKNADFDLK